MLQKLGWSKLGRSELGEARIEGAQDLRVKPEKEWGGVWGGGLVSPSQKIFGISNFKSGVKLKG